MQFLPWGLVMIAGIAAGAVACATMVVRRRTIAPLLGLECLSLVLLGFAIETVWGSVHRADLVIASIAIALGACGGGYALCAGLIAVMPGRREPTEPLLFGAPLDGTLIVLLSDEEPEDYEPMSVTAALARYAEGDIDLPPEIARPLIYASERSRYHRAGRSPARDGVRAVADSLGARLASDGVTSCVSVAFCDGEPSLEDVVRGIAAAGGRRIVLAPLGVAWSRAFTEAVDALPLGELAAGDVSVERTGPLWPSPHLSAMLAQRALAALAGDRAGAGVILLSEGDSWEHARSQEAYREQLVFFIQRVRCELVEAGIAASRIRRASLWLGEPDVTEAVRHLAAVGARRIVLVPATFACETISTQVDLPYAADRAQADTGTAVVSVAPWGNDPAVIEALRDAVVEHLSGQGTVS